MGLLGAWVGPYFPDLDLNIRSEIVWSDPRAICHSEAVDQASLAAPHSEFPHLCPHLGANEEENNHQGWAGLETHPGHFLGTEKGDAG